MATARPNLDAATIGDKDLLGRAIEAAVPASQRHAIGQYFTPTALVDLVMDLVGTPAHPNARVLEPACGSGRFLIAARARWSLPASQLCGYETDPLALAAAREQLNAASITDQDFLDSDAKAEFCRVVGNPPYVRDRGRGRDLYADFIQHSIAHLREGGRLALVLSNAWLDVDYGRQVRDHLLDTCALEWLVESTAERWFQDARINTMILVARRCFDPRERAQQEVAFAQVQQPLPAQPTVLRTVTQSSLTEHDSWGPLLRAPQQFFSVRSGPLPVPLVALGELAEVKRGFTTNDNGFFYPPNSACIESCYLHPLLKSPRRVSGLHGLAASLPEQVFCCARSRIELQELGHLGALAWIDAHRSGQPLSSWMLPVQQASRLFLVKGTSDRFRQPLFDAPVFYDQQLYSISGAGNLVAERSLAALLNSTWCKLSIEMAGRVNFGDGVLWLALRDAREKILLPDLRLLDPSQRSDLAAAFDAFPRQAVPPICRMEDELSSAWWAAQLHLDEQVGALLGLSSSAQQDLRFALLDRCRIRVTMPR